MSIITFPVHKPFLKILAYRLRDESRREPIATSKTLVLLPTRRACTALKSLMQEAAGDVPLILPRIQAIGDAESDAIIQAEWQAFFGNELQQSPKVISKMKRRFNLAKLCMAVDMDGGKPTISLAQALELANALATLMDELQRESIDLSKIEKLAPEDYAEHWQSILKFLRVITIHWPKMLAEQCEQDPVTFRNHMLDMLGDYWKKHLPEHKIIIAGSTASNLATAKLMQVVASLPSGEIILPALHLSEQKGDYWDVIEESHPHFFLKKFLELADVDVEKVAIIDHAEVGASCNESRLELIEKVMLPAKFVHEWAHFKTEAKALEDIQCLTLESFEVEAEIIALICKQHLIQKPTAICIVCEEPDLRTKIRYGLYAHDIIADASEGMMLAESAWGHFMQLLLNAAEDKHNPINVLSLLKHPYVRLSLPRLELLQATRFIELHAYRAQIQSNLLSLVKSHLASLVESEPLAKTAIELLVMYEKILAPLEQALHSEEINFSTLWETHQKAAALFTTDDAGDIEFTTRPSYAYIHGFAESLAEHAHHMGKIDPKDYATTLNQLMAREPYREFIEAAHSVRILPSAEARLEAADVIIISGMNEGSWPKSLAANPWMSRTMQSTLGLHLPEVNSSRMAHDLVMLMHTSEVILTRSLKANGAETLESRWLQRLRACTHAAPENVLQATFDNQPYLDWLQTLYQPEPVDAALQPAPTPPLSARPTSFSVTELETLQRDPYAVYAKRILKLKPLEPLGDAAPQQLFGEMVHAMLDEWSSVFLTANATPLTENAMETLAQSALNQFTTDATQKYLLKPRLLSILTRASEIHQTRKDAIAKLDSEKKIELKLRGEKGDYTISGRADRIETHHDNKVVVVDYKTGGVPAQKDVKSLIACQLPLECLMLLDTENQVLAENMSFEYWKLSSSEGKTSVRTPDKKLNIADFLHATEVHIIALLDSYMSEHAPYTAVPEVSLKPRYHTYEHLERYAEWV